MVEDLIINMREDVGIADSKDMSKHIVQPNKQMSGMGTSKIQTMMHAPSNAMIRIVAKCGVENMTMH